MGETYVSRMRNMVARNLTIPHRFVEVTEKDLPQGRTGWFNKLHLLEMFDGEVLYFDLDVVIAANIDHLVEFARRDKSKIYARDDYSYPVTKPSFGREATVNSSVMYWCGRKDMTGAEALIPTTHGDQGIITQLFWPHGLALFPSDSIRSFKYGMMRDGLPLAPITVMHGEPKNHQLGHVEFVAEHWR